MIIAGNQSYYFPFLGYFQLINAVDRFTLYDNLDFSENRWVHHNRIKLRNGNIFTLSVPLINRTSSTLISDLTIFDAEGNRNWRRKTCKTIYDNYLRAPMFRRVFPLLEALINYPVQSVSALNTNSLVEICRYLNIDTTIQSGPDIYADIELRLSDSKYMESEYPDIAKKDARIIEICRHEGADTLYNSMGGVGLYKKEIFLNYGIRVRFLKRKEITYRQPGDGFIPDLSIIDVLMYNDVPTISGMLEDYDLI